MMLVKRGQSRDDEDPVPGTGVADLDPRLVAEFVARLRQSRPYAFADLDDAPALRRAKVIVGGEGVVSLAGLLALAKLPREYLPQLMVSFVHYPTIDGADLSSGERFFDNPEPALREVIVNALLHRDLSRASRGTQTQTQTQTQM
jgi:ATP-dependent DNA helicase RecG